MSFRDPPREFTLIPFWFWNDALDESEMSRQLDDFQAHGVHGFVIHPRVGLPRDIAWMSDRMLHFMRFAIDEARRREMKVVLYDEGMYPSGSSSGQVVAENPAYTVRCLAKIDLSPGETQPKLEGDENLIAIIDRPDAGKAAIIDRRHNGYIRGLHYIGEGPEEDRPPAADILNPDAVACFIRLVYDQFWAHFKEDFGKTILAIFTDEPSPVGKRRKGMPIAVPGSAAALPHVNRLLGYDFTPFLAHLWYDLPDAPRIRAEYRHAIGRRVNETYYAQIRDWCEKHPGAALCGHPGQSDDIGAQRYFNIPGQDLVHRMVLPHTPSALEAAHSTMGKCSSSAMIHLGRRRNGNECFGAYGHELTYEETKWLSDWCFIRGVNLLYPHAFYYSYRGARRDERPPDVGPNSPWWGGYRAFADYCRRMAWVNTDSTHVCDVAILSEASHLPWRCAKVLFESQIDFNYVELRHLWEDARIDDEGLHLAGMRYRAVIIDEPLRVSREAASWIEALDRAGRLIRCGEFNLAAGEMLTKIDGLIARDVTLDPPSADIRYRHVIKAGRHYYLFCNEGSGSVDTNVSVSAQGARRWLDPMTGDAITNADSHRLSIDPYEMRVLEVAESD